MARVVALAGYSAPTALPDARFVVVEPFRSTEEPPPAVETIIG